MKERIRELAEQAGSTHKQSLGVYQFYTDELEKFTELIVRECAGVAEVSMPINSYPDDRLTVKNNVLKHFGVEE